MVVRLITAFAVASSASPVGIAAEEGDPARSKFPMERLELSVEKLCYESTEKYVLAGNGRFEYVETVEGMEAESITANLEAHEVRMAIEELLETGFLSLSARVKDYEFVVEAGNGRFFDPTVSSGCELVVVLESSAISKKVEYDSLRFGPQRLLERLNKVVLEGE